MNNFFNLIIKGIFVGIANVIPGVSGGTIAVVLRIFDQLIESINNFFSNPKKYLKFLFPIIIGALVGVGLFSKFIEFSLERFSFPTNMFFVGLVIGSIPLIYSKAREKGVKSIYFLASIISFIIVVSISLLKEPVNNNSEITLNLSQGIKIFLGGIMASSAMIIPGISGSFVMVLLGLYNIIISSISNFIDILGQSISSISDLGFINMTKNILTSESFIILLTIGIGIIIGVILISKIIAILLSKAFSITYFSILGLIFASIFSIFKEPMTYQSYNGNIGFLPIISGLTTLIIGFFIAYKLGKE